MSVYDDFCFIHYFIIGCMRKQRCGMYGIGHSYRIVYNVNVNSRLSSTTRRSCVRCMGDTCIWFIFMAIFHYDRVLRVYCVWVWINMNVKLKLPINTVIIIVQCCATVGHIIPHIHHPPHWVIPSKSIKQFQPKLICDEAKQKHHDTFNFEN